MDIRESNFLLNELKHRMDVQLRAIRSNDSDRFYHSLLKLGASQMDVYMGRLTSHDIFGECIAQLKEEGIVEREVYERILRENSGYFSMELSDSSQWVYRLGLEKNRFVHIHPGRHSLHTFRIKANNLKTVLAMLFEGIELTDIDNVNRLRQSKLRLSPVKSLVAEAGIGALVCKYTELLK